MPSSTTKENKALKLHQANSINE